MTVDYLTDVEFQNDRSRCETTIIARARRTSRPLLRARRPGHSSVRVGFDRLVAVARDQRSDRCRGDRAAQEAHVAVAEEGVRPARVLAAEGRRWPVGVEGQVVGPGPGDGVTRLG